MKVNEEKEDKKGDREAGEWAGMTDCPETK